MQFDLELVEAQIALELIARGDTPSISWDALQAGLDCPAIRRLVLLGRPGLMQGFENGQSPLSKNSSNSGRPDSGEGAIISYQKLQWLFPVAVTLHNGEEALSLPGWALRHAGQLALQPPGAGEIRIALLVLTLAAFAVTYLSARNGKQSLWAYLQFGSIVAVLVNVFVPHVPATLMFRSYTPGVVTAVLLNLPLMNWLAFRAVWEQWVSGRKAVVFSVAVPLALGAVIMAVFAATGLV